MIKTATLAIVGVMIATGAQLLLRAGMERVGYIGANRLGKPIALAVQVATEPRVVLGLLLFGFSAAMWLVVLSRIPLSLAYPFAGLTYLFVTIFSRWVLHEQVPPLRWFALSLIVAGIVLVGVTAPAGVE